MVNKHRVMALAAALGLALAASAPLGAQEPAQRMLREHQMLRVHEQAALMDEAMNRMSRVQERAYRLEQQMIQEMERLWQYRGVQEGDDVPMMLQSHERMRDMAHALGESARQAHRAMLQLREMIREPGASWSPEAEQDLDQLRRHWDDTALQMEGGLTIMERLRERMGTPGTSR